MSDQIRINNPAFDTLQASVLKVSTDNAEIFEIPVPKISTFTSNSLEWVGFWGKSKFKKSATQIDNENTKAMKSKYIQFLRPFIKQYFYDNPLVSDADIIKAGLKPHSPARTVNKSTSAEIPDVTGVPMPGHVIKFTCLNSSGTKSKPAKIVFVRIRWIIGANAATDPFLFTKFNDFSAHPIQITFDPADAGKPLAYAICYVTNKGQEAPYTHIVNTIVP